MVLNANYILVINSASLTISVITLTSFWLKVKSKLYISQMFSVFIIVFLINKYFSADIAYLTPLLLALLLCPFFRLNQWPMQKAILLSLLVMDTICVFIYATSGIFQLMGIYTPNMNDWGDIIIAVLLITLSAASRVYLNKYKHENLVINNKLILPIITYLLIFLVLITIFYPRATRGSKNTILKITGNIMIAAFGPLAVFFINYLNKIEKEKLIAKKEYDLQQARYQEVVRKEDFIIKALHDNNSFLKVLKYQYDNKDFAGIGNSINYILFPENKRLRETLSGFENYEESLKAIENNLIKGLLSETLKHALALENIRIILDIKRPLIDLYIKDLDLLKVMNELLVNAIRELNSIPPDKREEISPYLQIIIEPQEFINTFIIINTLNPFENISSYKGFGKGINHIKGILGDYGYVLSLKPDINTYEAKFSTGRS